jgi:putative transcriptional regulator
MADDPAYVRQTLTPEDLARIEREGLAAFRARAMTDAEIDAAVAGDPDAALPLTDTQAEAIRIQWLRNRLGMSQTAFADAFGIPLRTLQQWEQGRRMPDATAITLLRVIEREPDAVRRVVQEMA